MLASARLQTIICTTRLPDAERFYAETLGLPVKGRSHSGIVFDVGGGDLLVMPVPSWQPSDHTAVGFAVSDLSEIMIVLQQRGVKWERVPHLLQDESGVVFTPWGAKVVWFRDPDGNILSIVQYA